MAGSKGTGGPREEVNTGRAKLYMRRNDKAQFAQATEVGTASFAARPAVG